jgi:hypothetical protein
LFNEPLWCIIKKNGWSYEEWKKKHQLVDHMRNEKNIKQKMHDVIKFNQV